MQKQGARIFHSPLRIGNREVNRRGPTALRPLHFGGHGDLAVYSVDVEPAVHSYRRLSPRRNSALNSVRPKRNFRIALASRISLCILRSRIALPLSPLLASTTISPLIFPEAGSRLHGSVLQLKRSLHGVKYVAQSELDGGLRRIKLECRTLSRG